ncbi:NAD(P)-binding protein [Peniophora sp. CONT]|nr:NAD(P)-binding protein [Peniophora sp. CONT]
MGNLVTFIKQSFPPKPKWTADNMPDLTGKVVIVTGGNTGIGKETVKALLQHNAKVYLAARSPDRAAKAIQELKTETGKEAIFLQLDLSDLPAVRKAAEEFLSNEKLLHILFNNAGVMSCPTDYLTVQGYDMQLGTNVIGHYFFTTLLLPALEAASTTGEKARVINTSSFAAYMKDAISYDAARDGPARKKYSPEDLYWFSKLGNALFAREMAKRYGDKIVSVAVNPGNLRTELTRHMSAWQRAAITILLYPASTGAITQLWGGTAPEAAAHNGKFLIPWAREGPMPAGAKDPAAAEKLWAWLEEQCKDF